MLIQVVTGDLLDQPVDAVVNPWNRNTIPWWLLLPQGVSGGIKQRAGAQVFKELARHGRLALGQAVATGAGDLPFKAIIHVAGIDDLWTASDASVRASVSNAVQLACSLGLTSLAIPLIGAGSGRMPAKRSLEIILAELQSSDAPLSVIVVLYGRLAEAVYA